MGAPPLLLAATLAFWGWQTGYLIPGIALGLAIEASRLIDRRIDFSEKDYNRISDLCAVIFGAAFVYRLVAQTGSAARWMPMILFPLLAAQTYGARDAIPLSTLFWAYRRKRGSDRDRPTPGISVTYPYFALTLLAASAGNMRGPYFYPGILTLIAWALYGFRPKGRSPAWWLSLMAVVAVLGWVGQVKLHELHLWVEKKGVDWFVLSEDRDLSQNATSIGEIGRLHLAGGIEFRVRPLDGGKYRTFLLREASYNKYFKGRWFAMGSWFEELVSTAEGSSWMLTDREVQGPAVYEVRAPLNKGRGVLKLPTGAYRVRSLPAGSVRKNTYGAIQVVDGPGLASYIVDVADGSPRDAPPLPEDEALPEQDRELFEGLAAELKLADLPPPERVRAVYDYFMTGFEYTLDLGPETDEVLGPARPLKDFLLRTRSGHCEYFATAAVLLLRAAGVPARYGAGYMVHEYSSFEEAYVVRTRHAHAWAMAYVDGAWMDLDTTPPDWTRIESDHAPYYQRLADAWNFISYKFSQWRYGDKGNQAQYVWWLVAPLVAILGWRLVFRKRRTGRDRRPEAPSEEEKQRPGADSEMYRIEQRLAELGFVRAPSETLGGLVRRIRSSRTPIPGADDLPHILRLHYRLRFDPKGLDQSGRRELTERVERWLEERNRQS